MSASNDVRWQDWSSPVGRLRLVSDGVAITRIRLPREVAAEEAPMTNGMNAPDEIIAAAIAQLDAYFSGELETFDLPTKPCGTVFQRTVWRELERIPYGETISYQTLAERIGKPSACRAVGRANGSNPIPIVIPCHRVIGKKGALTGFGGGIDVKATLLELEGNGDFIAHSPRYRELELFGDE